MTITTETWSATPTGWGRLTNRGTVDLSRVAADNTGAALSATNENYRRTTSLGGLDQFVECPMAGNGVDANRTLFLTARHPNSATFTCYAMGLNANAGTLVALRYVSGSASNITTGQNTGWTWSPGDLFQFRVTGSGATVTLALYRNGTSIYTTTDVDASRIVASGNTYAGLGFYNCGTDSPPALRVGQWRAGLVSDLAAPTGPEPGRFLLAY
jgi:hypothetical protein